MSKLYQKSKLDINTENPQRYAYHTIYTSKSQYFPGCQWLQEKTPPFAKIGFNSKPDNQRLVENKSEFLNFTQNKLSQSNRQLPKRWQIVEKPTYLSTVWQQIKDKPECAVSYIARKIQEEYPCLALRKTETSQTQSSLICGELFSNKIEDYKMIKLLGKGRFGQVFLACDRRSGFLGAMKVLKKREISKLQPEQRQKMIKQLTNEIKIQSFMNHPNIIKLHTFFHDFSNIYLFLELGTDGHLLDLLEKRQKLQEETTSIIIREVIRGVRQLHRQKIIHRDIKLENIVLTYGMAKVCDFGWAVYQEKNMRSTLCGTPIYLSPEILKGKKYNQKIDVWAVGTLAFEIAVGQNPFGVKRREDLSNIVIKDFEMSVGSPQLKSFISFILRKDPQRRPDAEILMKHPFITKFKNIQTSEELCQITAK